MFSQVSNSNLGQRWNHLCSSNTDCRYHNITSKTVFCPFNTEYNSNSIQNFCALTYSKHVLTAHLKAMRENPLCAQTAFTAIYHRYYTMYSIYTTDKFSEKLSVGMTIQSRKNGPKTRPRKRSMRWDDDYQCLLLGMEWIVFQI